MHVDGNGLTNLTNNPARDVDPVWAPDGKRIAFESDRNGFMQIYVMNADGSNVIQLTNDKADHIMSLNNNRSLAAPWSPDGNQLAILQKADAEKWMLYALDINNGTKTSLVNELGIYSHATWSPDGKHVAFISNDSQNVSLNNIYVVNADGSNLTEVTQNLPKEEIPNGFFAPDYYWSRDGQSIFFVASNMDYIAQSGVVGDSNDVYNWKAYEASLDGTLTLNATTHSPIGGWWQGDYFITPFGTQGWTWVHAKGVTTVNPFRNCEGLSGGGAPYQQSSNGNVVIGAMCPNFDWWLYWVNSKGTMLQLIDSPIPTSQGNMQNLTWSQDDKFIAFDITTADKTDLYIVNVSESKNDPSIQPVKITLGEGSLNFNMSWKPIVNDSIVEQNTTPEPLTFSLTINEAETLAGFDVLEPSYVPAGYTLEGIAYDLQTQKVVMKYVSQENSGLLFINQQPGVFIYDPSTQANVTPVPIGNIEAKYVQGAWIYDKPETTTPRWDSSAAFYSLNWQKDSLTYSIDFIGGESVTPPLLSEFVAIAESLK